MTAACASCHRPLVISVDASDEDESGAASSSGYTETVPDDVHLISCNCHFHWQCLLDAYELTSCPSCSKRIVTQAQDTGKEQILCDLNNEGGLQKSYDIFGILAEESYLKAFPEERKARAFLEFCRTGDVPAIVRLLKDEDSDDEDEDEGGDQDAQMDVDGVDEAATEGEGSSSPATDILRYQDPIGDRQSGLHYAVAQGSREVVWLLLLLASELDLQEFPPIVFQEAAAFGIMRDEHDNDGKVDIRSLRDANGKSAEDYAIVRGNPWRDWIGKGFLSR